MYIVFDTETTGKALSFSAPITDFNNWPRMVQIAWKVFDRNGIETDSQNLIIKPQGYVIPDDAIAIHRITNERAKTEGIPLEEALNKFASAIKNSKYLIAHNITFDENVVGCEFLREGMHNCIPDIQHIDTMKLTTEFVGIPNIRGRSGFKYPSQTELHQKLFNKGFEDAHDALADVTALANIFFELQRIGVLGFKESDDEINPESLSNYSKNTCIGGNIPLAPLGIHTFHSILEGAGSTIEYIKLAKENGHTSMAITDNGTLSGTFEFYMKCKANGIKPIFGVEILLNDNIGKFDEQNKSLEGDSFKIKIFIKDKIGYSNLNHLIYLANTEGYYKQEGRITTDWLLKYKNGLILSTSGLDGKLASMVLRGREIEAESYINMLRSEFGEDLIIELKFSKFPTQKQYNNFLIKMMSKYNILPVLSSDTYYPKKEDSILQDVVTSIKSHRPLAYCSLKENRELWYFNSEDYKNMNDKYGFKYPQNFLELCMKNTIRVAERCNFEFETGIEKYPRYEPTDDVIKYFGTDKSDEIIKKLAFAKLKQKIRKYQENHIVEMTEDKIKEYVDRLNYELQVIESKKMLDYFLVNWEIINYYRKQGYDIGPARGCFQIGSRVKMSDGMYAPIETIKHGDEVIDAFGNKQKVINRFEYDVDEDIIELDFDNGKKIICTLDHEILTNNRGWIAAKDLTEEDKIVIVDKEDTAKIKSRKIKIYKGKVFDLEVENSHSYNIEGLGVHNSAAGSLLSWCLDITKIDPIRFGLYFERFLNPERNCLTSNCNVMLKDGSYKNIVDVEIGDPVQTEHGLGKLVQKHERELREDESVYEIESEDGAKVQLTGCHIVPVFRDGNRIEVRVDEIVETDQLFVF